MDSVGIKTDVKKAGRYYRLFVLAQVLALAVMMAGTFGPQRRYANDEGPGFTLAHVRSDLQGGLKTTLGMFEVDCGRYPTTEEGLKILVSRPGNISVEGWRGPYFESQEALKDPWGHEYVYRFPGIHNTAGYDLYSCGVDGISKSGNDLDDINNWDADSPRGGPLREASKEGAQLLVAWRALLVIPILFVIRMIAANRSARFRAVTAGNRFADFAWLSMSAGVVFFNLIFLIT